MQARHDLTYMFKIPFWLLWGQEMIMEQAGEQLGRVWWDPKKRDSGVDQLAGSGGNEKNSG